MFANPRTTVLASWKKSIVRQMFNHSQTGLQSDLKLVESGQ